MNRRVFLKTALLALASLFLQKFAAARGEKILVIGAGIAGLAAARELKRRGFEVAILEGRDRIGGRIWTDRSLGGVPVDLGASWIHGHVGNPVTQLAEEFKVRMLTSDYEDYDLYDADGKLVSQSKVDVIWLDFETFLKDMENLGESIESDITMAEALRRVTSGKKFSDEDKRFLNWCLASASVEAGAEMEELSQRYSQEDEEFDGDEKIFPDGYDQIIAGLSQDLEFKLNQKVRRIEQKNDRVVVTTEKDSFEADRVLVTLPLGVLKADTVEFSPPLPEAKRKAIERLGMGVLNKVVLQFEEPFWPEKKDFLSYASNEAGQFPEFMNVYGYERSPILVALTGGNFARAIEKKSEEEVIREAQDVLRKIYGSKVSKLQAYRITRWASDPFSGGAYSHVPLGATPADYDALAEPVDQRVFFAGEATHRKYPGTVHGAFLSGIREAERIAKGSSLET